MAVVEAEVGHWQGLQGVHQHHLGVQKDHWLAKVFVEAGSQEVTVPWVAAASDEAAWIGLPREGAGAAESEAEVALRVAIVKVGW